MKALAPAPVIQVLRGAEVLGHGLVGLVGGEEVGGIGSGGTLTSYQRTGGIVVTKYLLRAVDVFGFTLNHLFYKYVPRMLRRARSVINTIECFYSESGLLLRPRLDRIPHHGSPRPAPQWLKDDMAHSRDHRHHLREPSIY